jgi:hypothetical protein
MSSLVRSRVAAGACAMSVAALAWALSACMDGHGLEQAYKDVFTPLVELFQALYDAHPAAVRAYAGLRCDTDAVCRDGQPWARTCVLEDEALSGEFRAGFVACALTCQDAPTCLTEALREVEVEAASTRADQRLVCLESASLCQVETDACDALPAILSDHLANALERCNDGPCDQLQACYRDVLLADVPIDEAYRGAP